MSDKQLVIITICYCNGTSRRIMDKSLLKLPRQTGKRLGLLALGFCFVLAGGNHFHNPHFYLRIMPPYLPAHLELVYLSGLFEILGGVGVLVPRIRRLSGWGLMLLMLAVFPANIHMAVHPELFSKLPTLALYARLPLQLLLIYWAWWATRPGRLP